MIDFIPLGSYTPYFNYAVLVLMCIVLYQCQTGTVLQRKTVAVNAGWGFFIVVALILYMGLRPVSVVFGDTVNYASGFRKSAASSTPFEWKWGGEWVFYNLMRFFAKYSNVSMFFLTCATVYVGALALAMWRMFKTYYFVPLLVIIGMFTFWSYGVNGMRNGMGASLFILAMTYVENLPIAITLCILATGIHQSIWMMVAAAVVAWFIKKSYYYLAAWMACIVLSFVWGNTIQAYLAHYSFINDQGRLTGYLTGQNVAGEGIKVSMSFRWDFLAYSAMGVAVGYYFIFRRDFRDQYYHWIYNVYLVTNAIWVLVIRATYSNRLAQISWFILPVVLIYPFMKKRFWKNHEKMLAYSLMVFYAFTFVYNIVLQKA